ncbi:LuxR C-terminal-related transcriptional regulator [Pseudoduganella sp. UC29_71]|uniref:LuxR C-terminal-related transcriptional regulator n=1 Tax=Pseudoduganella sp. UC29_71 TaxID=3350174 RepID=UPI00366EE0E2
MEQAVILSKLEQEYLLGAIEASLSVRELRSYFLWSQGQLQALLPHRVMVCMQFGPAGGQRGALLRIECLHGTILDRAVLTQLCEPAQGLAPRLARHAAACAQARARIAGDAAPARPVALAAAPQRAAGAASGAEPENEFAPELLRLGLDNVLLHGSGALPGGSTCFALFGMPQRPGPRQAYFLELLLPHLHFALLRLDAAPAAAPAERAVSRREMEILHWVREGKSNTEVGQILGISGLTVKNHLQRIYRTLGVSNRTQAVARGIALRLLDGGAAHA